MAISAITPFLWYDHQAEQAAEMYVSLFENSRITHVSRQGPGGAALVVGVELQGQRLTLLNGGPHYSLTPAFSLLVECSEQAEIDRLWQELGQGGSYQACGWLTDRFGLSWQVNYSGLSGLMTGGRAPRVMAAMMGMTRIDIAGLEGA